MVGTFMYMICAILVIAGWCGRNLWWVKMIEIFPFSAIILYPFNAKGEYDISQVGNRNDIFVYTEHMEHLV